MAVLETIRTKIGWLITILIAVALLSFIVDFNSLSSAINSSSSKYSVGEINGKKIPYKDFQEQVEYQTNIAEMLGGNAANSDEGQKNIRNAAWQHFVDNNLFIKNAKAAGIEVGKAEMVDLTYGENLSPIMVYDPVFGNQNGKFDRQQFKQFIDNIDADQSGNSRIYWQYVQNSVLTQQYYAKYASLFSASNMPNKLTLQDAIEGNNTSASIDYVMVPAGYEQDSTIVVSNSEIKKFYNDNKEMFKQVQNRDITYAYFEVTPSEADQAAANDAIMEVYDEFAQADNMKNFLMRNSEQAFSEYYYKEGELNTVNSQLNDFVFGKDSRGVSPVIKDDMTYYAAKVVSTKVLPDSVYVRHILIQGDTELADSLFNVLKAGKTPFSQLAAIYSADKNENVPTPGDLGWMTQTYMIPGMESVLAADVNKPFVLDTQYGRHIVEVTKKTKGIEKKQVAILKKTAVPSKATMNEAYGKANSLATKAAGSLEKLEAAAQEEGVYLFKMNVNDATATYNGATRAKEITRWVFDAKKGQVSNVITINQNYLFVVGVVDTHKEGYATVAESAARIKNVLYNEKKIEKMAGEVKAKIEGCTTIEDVAKALGQTVSSRENVTFSSMISQDNEPALLGAVASAEVGKVVGPVKGYMGVYVVTVKDRQSGAFYTEDDAQQMENQKNQYNFQRIVPVMLEQTGSVDHRERFY